MSNYKWYAIGTEIKIKLQFYLFPLINKVHLKKYDSNELFVFNVKYVYAKNKKEAKLKYDKYHKIDINKDIENYNIDLIQNLDLYSIIKETINLHNIRNSFISLFYKSNIINDETIILNKNSNLTLTQIQLMNKCSIQDYLLYYKQEFYKNNYINLINN